MKHILRKLHIGGNHDSFEGRGHDVGGRVLDGRAADVGGRVLEGRGHDVGALNTGETSTHSETHSSLTSCGADQRGLSGISGWLNNARHSLLPSNATRSRFDGSGGAAGNSEAPRLASVSGTSDSELDFKFYEEEYQVQLALALSVSNNDVLDDPESLQIRAAKRISLGRPPSPGNSPSEFISNRYWNYNVIDYDEKVVDGFYDVYGVISDFGASEKMPSLVDLQGTPVSNNLGYEVVLVNRGLDPDLVQLEQAALYLAVECGANEFGSRQGGLAQKIADLVVGHMGGPVIDASEMLMRWRARSYELRTSLNNIVLPLGCLQIGFSRHRALLFKVLADHVGIPCRLVKGSHYTGTDEGAVNIIKVDNDREYIIDLMGAPGTLLPAEIVGMTSQLEQVENAFPTPFDAESSTADTSGWQNLTGNQTKGFCNKNGETNRLSANGNTGNGLFAAQESTMDFAILEGLPTGNTEGKPAVEGASPPNLQPQQGQLRRLNTWTGVGSPAFQMKVKDVSQYMMDAAKDNPQLAQRLHDVLLESGVIAPPDLFGDIQQQQLQVQRTDEKVLVEDGEAEGESKYSLTYGDKSNVVPGWPVGSAVRESAEASEIGADGTSYNLLSVEGIRPRHSPDPFSFVTISWSPTLAIPTAAVLNAVQETISPEIMKRVPVAAAAAATAAAVASSMVAAAAAISDSDSSFEVPAAATATATTAVVVATPAAIKSVSKGNELSNKSPSEKDAHFNQRFQNTDFGDKMYPSTDNVGVRKDCVHSADEEIISEDQIHVRLADHSNTKADNVLDDVAEWEIPWEEIVIGDRIGLGSYGEVYHGDWHGTEVAVKKFLDQGLSGDALDEFISEVRIMRRMRHPNVVLFMGAVTRPPNLSIVTEYLPRGSLFRLLHRPNILIDEKRRLKMALDVAKGMNYLHTSTPIIVHRDLKSPNLLVDKNWVVKVCDFGLSRLKHHTFLSSKSTAGTPEWMAPEVLRNEPSNEKCDVYSFGVILWELATLRQPWSGMNPMQVVGAVGFQNRRLEIPENLDPYVARIIHQCWQNDPRLRPSFSELMAWIKPLQRLIVSRQLGTPGAAYPL